MRFTFQNIKDVVLLLAGLAIFAHEMLSSATPRTELLVAAGAMVGLPSYLATNRKLRIPGINAPAPESPDPPEPTTRGTP